MNKKIQAMVNSQHGLREVKIVKHEDNNNVIAKYRGTLYTAVYNPFAGLYYVDDIYGRLEDQNENS